jgi:hypothetical protein
MTTRACRVFAGPLLGAVFLFGCGLSPQGDFARRTAATAGARIMDAGVENAEWFLCNAASIAAVKRRYGRDQHTADAYRELCDGDGQVDLITPVKE